MSVNRVQVVNECNKLREALHGEFSSDLCLKKVGVVPEGKCSDIMFAKNLKNPKKVNNLKIPKKVNNLKNSPEKSHVMFKIEKGGALCADEPCGSNKNLNRGSQNSGSEKSEKLESEVSKKVRKYQRKQYEKKKRIKQREQKRILCLEAEQETASKQISRKELLEQQRYRARLRKIYSTLNEDVIPRIAFEIEDETDAPLGVTIAKSEVIIPPKSFTYVEVVPIAMEEFDIGTYVVTGAGRSTFHSVGDAQMAHKKAIVQISNHSFDIPWVIKKGDKIGSALRVKWQTLPTLDNIYENEQEFIINNISSQVIAQHKLTGSEASELKESVKDELSSKASDPVGADRLPSAAARKVLYEKIKDVETRSKKIADTLRKVEPIFITEDPGEKFRFIKVPPVRLLTKDKYPGTISPLYNKSFTNEEKQAIDLYIKQALENGMIERAPDSPYASPILVTRKKADPLNPKAPVKWRILIDSRLVNSKVLQDSVFPAPSVDEAARTIGTGKIHSIFDVRSAFHRLQLHEDSRNYTAFLYNGSGEFFGVHRYRSLNQGGSQSPKLFCHAISDAFRHLF